MTDNEFGPNVRKLFARFIAREAIPDGGSMADGMDFFTNPEKGQRMWNAAMRNMSLAIHVIKSAPDNPYGDDDEAIAKAILDRLEERKRKS